MNDYVIITDSTSDLPSEIVNEIQVDVIPMKFIMEDKSYLDGEMPAPEFYGKLRNKILSSTSQISPGEFEQYFSKYLDKGKDVIYISLSSALSGTYSSACVAAQELLKRYPQNKVVVIDSLSVSLGEGLLVYTLAKKKQSGASLEELATWIEENKKNICHWFMVDDLNHLRRGGRISQVSAFFGSMMSIRPILHVDSEGKLSFVEKARGRHKAIDFIVSKMEELGVNVSEQIIFISHGDCEEDAKNLAEKIKSKSNVKNVVINYVGPVIGSHAGSGALALFFIGKHR